jgi:hypothetical protein
MISIKIEISGPTGSGKTRVMDTLTRALGPAIRVVSQDEQGTTEISYIEIGEDTPLGYSKNGAPIFAIKPGRVTTACVISCVECHTVIRGMGGPQHGVNCVNCFEKGAK